MNCRPLVHRTLGLYGLAIWAPHVSFMCVSLLAQCEMFTDLPIWAWYLGPTWVLYGFALMSLVSWLHMRPLWACPYWLVHMGPLLAWPYGTHMGPIRSCPYGQARIHPTLGPYGIAIWAHMGPLRACSYGLVRMGTIGVLYEFVSGPHMGSLWACPYGLAIWAPHVSIMSSPYWSVRM